ncbi:uncharacterized protein AMSG_03997 [Thecamonas trahens ATCC 50062]|uniref:FAM13A-like domain-containing protein n=1 Tax=Thecamonas trahens ATCC 50062 TaxID=461836 RepID=A0A0L0D6E3_THETB|nr:hypothetical protein AMSG_03997 [Thecamonas trahens ATCC 50062]KNC47770.1 hypothetical protein AMSG_03997 [Thecamonas trahens ATCC 50062]|eukprot:XP_013759248.1 hypothetical protein AMSG_03997 [Thecamonas trahens ATCC 50062]
MEVLRLAALAAAAVVWVLVFAQTVVFVERAVGEPAAVAAEDWPLSLVPAWIVLVMTGAATGAASWWWIRAARAAPKPAVPLPGEPDPQPAGLLAPRLPLAYVAAALAINDWLWLAVSTGLLVPMLDARAGMTWARVAAPQFVGALLAAGLAILCLQPFAYVLPVKLLWLVIVAMLVARADDVNTWPYEAVFAPIWITLILATALVAYAVFRLRRAAAAGSDAATPEYVPSDADTAAGAGPLSPGKVVFSPARPQHSSSSLGDYEYEYDEEQAPGPSPPASSAANSAPAVAATPRQLPTSAADPDYQYEYEYEVSEGVEEQEEQEELAAAALAHPSPPVLDPVGVGLVLGVFAATLIAWTLFLVLIAGWLDNSFTVSGGAKGATVPLFLWELAMAALCAGLFVEQLLADAGDRDSLADRAWWAVLALVAQLPLLSTAATARSASGSGTARAAGSGGAAHADTIRKLSEQEAVLRDHLVNGTVGTAERKKAEAQLQELAARKAALNENPYAASQPHAALHEEPFFVELVREKMRLQRELVGFRLAFQAQYGRDLESLADRAPVESSYQRYQTTKQAIRVLEREFAKFRDGEPNKYEEIRLLYGAAP